MDNVIKAETRDTGKGAARAVRRDGQVPCILYGHGQDSLSFQVPRLELRKLIFGGGTQRIELQVGRKKYDCIVKTVDFHPVSDEPIHADFQILKAGERIQLTVPVRLLGQAPGVVEGGDLQHLAHELEVSVLPKDIPDHLEVDISGLSIGDTIHVSDLEYEGVELLAQPQRAVVAVTVKRVVEEEEVEEEGLEGEELLEGEEATEGGEAPADAGEKSDGE